MPVSSENLLLWRHLPKVKESAIDSDHADWVRENIDRIHMGGHAPGSFSRIHSGLNPPQTVQHDLDILAQIAKLAKPGAQVAVAQAVARNPELAAAAGGKLVTTDRLLETMKLAGMSTNALVSEMESEDREEIAAQLGLADASSFVVVRVDCKMPEFEVGSSMKLSFADKVAEKRKAKEAAAAVPAKAKAAVWSIDDMDDDDVELVDSDQLLGEEDLAKPDPASLRVCGTTGKRKACKDCSCGLAEELAEGKEVKAKDPKSACGSCYLGDAFRCASCPYLGMPAFKPGEKIQLSERQLNADQ